MCASLLRKLALAIPGLGLVLAGCGAGSAPPATPSGQAGTSPATTASASAAAKPAAAVSASASAAGKPATGSASAATAASPNASALPKLSIPYSAIAASNAPFWMPVEAGLYKKYGLDVTTEYIATSATLMPA